LADRVVLMENGKVVMDGPRDLVLQKLMQNEQNKVKAAQQAQENQRSGEAAQA